MNGGTELGYEVGELDIMGKPKKCRPRGPRCYFFASFFLFDSFLFSHGLDDPPSDSIYVNFLVTVNAASVREKAKKSD